MLSPLKYFRGYESLQTRIALALFSAVLLILSFPAFNLYLLEWVAFVPLFIAIRNQTFRQTYLLATLTGTVAVFGGFYWVGIWAEGVMEIPFPANHLFTLGYAFYCAQAYGIIFSIFGKYQYSGKLINLFIFPTILTAIWSLFPLEFIYQLGDGQTYFLPAIQGVDLTGVFGLNWMIAFVNFALFDLIFLSNRQKRLWRAVVILTPIVCWFAYGWFSLLHWDSKIEQWSFRKIGIVQPNRPATISRPEPEQGYSRLYPLEIEMTQQLAEDGAELVIWPEGNFFGYSFWVNVRAAFQKEIAKAGVPIIFPDTTVEYTKGDKIFHNSSLWLNNKGKLEDQYHKIQLVPFGEYTPIVNNFPFLESLLGEFLSHLTPGKVQKTFQTTGMRLVPILCYESLFPQFVAESIGKDSLGKVILVQSQDGWYGKSNQPEQHLTSSVLRAVENRVPLIHVINNGPSAIALPNGRYVFYSTPFTRGEWIAEMPYYAKSGGSFYSSHPSLFINLIRFMAVLIILSHWNLFIKIGLLQKKPSK